MVSAEQKLLKNYPPVLCVKQVEEILSISHNTAVYVCFVQWIAGGGSAGAYLRPCGFYSWDDPDQ